MIKRTTISLRIDRRTQKRLERLCEKTDMSKSDVVRQGIKMMTEMYMEDDDVEVSQISEVVVEDKPSDGDVGADTGV